MPEEVTSLIDLLRVGGHWGPRAVQTAARLGVWDALSAGPATTGEAARRLGASERGVALLCDALVALGLLRKAQGRYANTDYAAGHLVRSSPDYDGGLLEMDDATWTEWERLPEAVRVGRPVARERLFHADARRTEILLRALYRRAIVLAPPMVQALRVAGEGSLLDVGGGMGGFTAALLGAAPGWRATIFDLPTGCRLAREAMARDGLAGRVTVVEGDFEHDPLPGEHDLVLLAAIVHGLGPDQNRALVAKCARALRPGGRFVVRDYVMNDELTEPAAGAIFGLQMLLHTERGRCYAADEIANWMRGAGLADVEVLPAEAMAMTARKI